MRFGLRHLNARLCCAGKSGKLSVEEMRIGFRHLNVRCPNSRCCYRACGSTIDTFLGSHTSNLKSVTFCNFRKFFLLLPQDGVLEEYWLKAGDPASCDLRCSVPHAGAALFMLLLALFTPWLHVGA